MDVLLTQQIIGQISKQAGDIVRRTRPKPPLMPEFLSPELAETIHTIGVPYEVEQKAMELLPTLMKRQNHVYLRVTPPKDSNFYQSQASGITKNCHIAAAFSLDTKDIPGFKRLQRDSNVITVEVSDYNLIEDEAFRDHVKQVFDYYAFVTETEVEVARATQDMTNYLRKYDTLQQAVAGVGPTLLEFVPHHLQEMYNQPTNTTLNRDKELIPPADITYLIAKATTNMLNLNKSQSNDYHDLGCDLFDIDDEF